MLLSNIKVWLPDSFDYSKFLSLLIILEKCIKSFFIDHQQPLKELKITANKRGTSLKEKPDKDKQLLIEN